MKKPPFLSSEPEVILVNSFYRPFDSAIASARTCYSSKGIITPEEVAGDELQEPEEKSARIEKRNRLARDIYQAGHHTVYQHAHFQFALNKISRHFVWSFLHSHPFYNSEQVSQRYVEVKPENHFIPPLEGDSLQRYEDTIRLQMSAYHRLTEMLHPLVETEYFKIFPGRRQENKKWRRAVHRKAMEIARYVLPVATFTYLYHTINGITLLRYHRVCEQLDAPVEQKVVVQKMVEELLRADPSYQVILEEPIPLEETPEYRFFQPQSGCLWPVTGNPHQKAFREEFDASLDGKVSKLISYKPENETLLARAVREVLGLPSSALSDDEAIRLAMDPSQNRYLGESLNLTTMGKITRAMVHPSWTFRKKLSHTADSQDQRHRMTPASRPVLSFHLSEEPDYITPPLILRLDEAHRLYQETMERVWEAIFSLRKNGVGEAEASYLLPNATSIRFTETADLLNLWHKHTLRLCYNAQEEIWRASLDEALQIREVNPRIGRYLLPPCGIRQLANVHPFCPEGERYCGIPVWKLEPASYQRNL